MVRGVPAILYDVVFQVMWEGFVETVRLRMGELTGRAGLHKAENIKLGFRRYLRVVALGGGSSS